MGPLRFWGIDSVKRLIANFISMSDALWVFDDDAEGRPLVTRVLNMVFDYLHDADFLEYYTRMSRDERENFTYHLLSRMDHFVCRMVKAGNEFATFTAIANGTPEEIDLTSYAKAFTGFADDFIDIKKTVNRGNKFATVTLLRPTPPAPAQAGTSAGGAPSGSTAAAAAGRVPKRTRLDDAASAPPANNRASHPPNNAPPRTAPAFGQPRVAGRYDVEHGRRMGDFVVRDDFSTIFAPVIADKFCPGFSVLGQACGRSECTKVHLPFGKWSADDQAAQIAHVSTHHPAISFNKASVRNLPEDKRPLLGDAPAAGM